MVATERVKRSRDALSGSPEWDNSRLGFAAGDYNLFRYVGNQAADEIDPSGNASYSDAKDAVKLAEEQLQRVRHLLQSDNKLKDRIVEEPQKYETLNTRANELVGEYERGVWYPWSWATALGDEANSLPASVGNESLSVDYLSSLQSAVSAQRDALRRLTDNADFAYSAAASFDKTLAIGIVIIAAAGAAAVVAPVTVTILAAGLITYNIGIATAARWRNGDGFLALPGAALDVSGASGFYLGATGRDIISQNSMGLSSEQRGEALGSGTASLVLWVVGGKVSKGGQKFASRYIKPSIFGRIEPNLPGIGRLNKWINANEDRDALVNALTPKRRQLYEFGLKTVDQWDEIRHFTFDGDTELTGQSFVEGAIARGQAFELGQPTPTNANFARNFWKTIPTGLTTSARSGFRTAIAYPPSIILTYKLSTGLSSPH